MNIGVLTYHRSYNYGAFMQCFSLVSRLKKDFPYCNIEVIDYTTKSTVDGYQSVIDIEKNNRIKNLLQKRNNSFINCQEKLPLSSFKIISNDYEQLIELLNKNYDIIIVGSDAVWNWSTRGFPNVYFLKDYEGVKYSYAASAHGNIYQNMTEYQINYLKEAYSDFKYIGVRDVTTENMVKFVNQDLEINHNCDPTMFLDLNKVPCDKLQLKEKLIKKGVDFSKPIIGIMAGNSIGYEIKKKYKDRVQLVAVYEPNKYADVFIAELTPFEWAHIFSFFKLTVTHFFHGTMLSLVNNVPVIPIETTNFFSEINTTKIKDLMTRLDLLDWRFERSCKRRNFFDKILYKLKIKIDKSFWNNVFKKIDEFLENDYGELIYNKTQKEQKFYNTFKESLSRTIQEQEKLND